MKDCKACNGTGIDSDFDQMCGQCGGTGLKSQSASEWFDYPESEPIDAQILDFEEWRELYGCAR